MLRVTVDSEKVLYNMLMLEIGDSNVPTVDSMRPLSVNLKPLIVMSEALMKMLPVMVDSLVLAVVQSLNALAPNIVNPWVLMVIVSEYVPGAT